MSRKRIPDLQQRRLEALLHEIYAELGTWPAVAEALGVRSHTHLAQVANGHRNAGRKLWGAVQAYREPPEPQGPRDTEVEQGPYRVRVTRNGDAPDTIPELLQRVRCLTDTALAEVSSYLETHEVSPFARGGLAALTALLEDAREGAEL
jgi:hypothetical protein